MAGQTIRLKPSRFRLGFLVHDVSRLRRTVVDNELKPLGITRSQWWVLANLTRHNGKPTMQTELAKVMDVGKVALGGLLDRLEENGYVIRRASSTDRRAKLVEMTPAGTELLAKIQDVAVGINYEMMEGMPVEDILKAQEILYRMKQRLIEMNGQSRGIVSDRVDGEKDAVWADEFAPIG